MHIADRMKLMQASGIRKVFDLGATLKAPVNLSIGQPHFDVSDTAKEAAIKAIREGKNGYTPAQGIAPLRDKVSEWFKKRGIKHESAMVTCGASGALTLAIMATIGPGDEVLMADPYFVSYKQLTYAAGGTPVYFSTYPSFVPDPTEVEAKITPRTRAIILNSPNNPTGALYPKTVITSIAKIAAKHGITIISDEVYDCFYYEGEPFSPGTLQSDVITINGMSKSASMTGWRLGFVCGNKAVIEEMIKLQQVTFVNAPTPVQYAALAVLNDDVSYKREEYRKRRDIVVNGLKGTYKLNVPQGAFYVFPEVPVPNMTAMDFCMKAVEKNLLIVPGNAFSERDTNFRISYANTEEMLRQGVKILLDLAKELRAKGK